TSQEIEAGFRLSCGVKAEEGMEIELVIAEVYDRKEAVLRDMLQVNLDHGVQKVKVQVSKPSLQDERGDWNRLHDELVKILDVETVSIKMLALEKLPSILRAGDFVVTVTLWDNQVLDVEMGDTTLALYGVAVDIGTTSVAVSLVDLNSAQLIRVVSHENDQTAYGADVISRISYANESREKRLRLKDTVKHTVNRLINQLIKESGISADSIYKMTVVSNTTMNHLFLGLDTSNLAVAPYVSVLNNFFELSASDLGIEINPEGRIITFPNIGSFVGGDTVGAVIGAPEVLGEGNHLLIDLGTNCELFLKTSQVMMACSTAAGPAFEGARITHGMRAKPGAIEAITISEDGVEIKVIGGQKASGICGSGLVEGIEQMKLAGIINKRGKIVDPEKEGCSLPQRLRDRIRSDGKAGREFVLSYGEKDETDVFLNQGDIGELQLAKGAVCAGIKTLVEMVGISIQDLDSIVLAGTFASYLNARSILEIGLVPNINPEKVKTAGNAAHVGAMRALLNRTIFQDAVELATKVKHVELGGNKAFTSNLMKSMYLERTN
ncbi:MAG: ASKHA domain-containing protein, partial [Bacillota bacterium]|nr:ASKHA domain-containing protein [Bacillota bacterium]